MMIYYVVLGVGILAGIAGQMLLKTGADAPTLVAQILRPSTLCGLALYGSAAFLYIFALRKIPVSVAFPKRVAFLCDRGRARPFPVRRAVWPEADRRHRADHGRRRADQSDVRAEA